MVKATHLLDEVEASYIIRDIVKGLATLSRECGVMHRDIKLDNILVKTRRSWAASDGTPWGSNVSELVAPIDTFEFKLGDLGLAKSRAELNGPAELCETMCGTPLNMAPEVMLGALYDDKADVWSLGTVLFQILTGDYPFLGRDFEDLKHNIKQGKYRIPKHISLSAACLDFLNSCLRYDADKRKGWDELLRHPFLLGIKVPNSMTP